jgi:hypothetical protein
VSRVLGCRFDVKPYPADLVFDFAERAVDLLDGQADVSISQCQALFATHVSAENPLLHGYAGDGPSGTYQDRPELEDFANHDALARGIYRRYASQSIDVRSILGAGADESDVVAQVRADLVDSQTTVQAVSLWCWENHLRRYTNGIPIVLGQVADVMLPFYDKSYADLWALAPLEGLRGRAWQKLRFIQSFPEMARIPHESTGQPLLPNPGLMARLWFKKLNDRVRSHVMGSERLKLHLKNAERHPYIYHLPNLASARQGNLLREKFEAVAGAAHRVFDLDLSEASWAALGALALPQPQPKRVAWTIGLYAQAIERMLAS